LRLRDVVPPALERRIVVLTGKDDPFEALNQLCSQGYVELAMLLLFYIAGAGEGNNAFMPYPMKMRLRGCEVFVDEQGSRILVAVETEDIDGSGKKTCVAVDDYTDDNAYFVRPCTEDEYRVSSSRTTG